MQLLKLDQVANNIELLLGGFFDATYNENRGPIQIVHQIQRVRSNMFFECVDFYRLISETEFTRAGQFNTYDRATDIVDVNTRGWRAVAIDRKTELEAAGVWEKQYVSLGDAIWAAYLHIVSGGHPEARALKAMYEYMKIKMAEDDNVFYHSSEWNVDHLEGKTVINIASAAIKRLKAVS